MNIVAIFAAAAALNWTMPDGKVVTETQELVPFDDGVKLELSREKILSMKAKRLDIIPDFAHAKKGEGGTVVTFTLSADAWGGTAARRPGWVQFEKGGSPVWPVLPPHKERYRLNLGTLYADRFGRIKR